MTELAIQRWLRERSGDPAPILAELERTYAIKAKQHPRFKELYCLKYSQIESPFSEQLVRECRGIILDQQNNWAIVSFFVPKFFNHGEVLAAEIDWSTARVEEKVDGSLMNLYYYAGAWQVASSGTPDAGGFVMSIQGQSQTQTFADLFWETFKSLGISLPDPEQYRNYTFSFELMTQQNRVIVVHHKPRIVLLGVRNNQTLEQYDTAPFGKILGCEVVRTFPLQSWEQCLEASRSLSPMESEGFVVVDKAWNRVKHKTPQYVNIAHLRDSKCSPVRLLEVIKNGESDEFLAYFPEWRPLFQNLRQRFDDLCTKITLDYQDIAQIPVQKDFAAQALKTPYSACLFQLRKGQVKTPAQWLSTTLTKTLALLLGLGEVQETSEATE